MNSDADDKREMAELEHQAAKWVLRRDRGLSRAEQDEWLDWLAADPRHVAVLARMSRQWKRLDSLAAWQPEHSAEPNPDLLAVPLRSRLLRFMPRTLLAAAAVAVLLAGAALLDLRMSTGADVSIAAMPEGGPQVLEDGTVVELNDRAVLTVRYSVKERRVQFEQGEAHFAVTRDPDRPFIVTAQGIEMRALGTAFNVRIDPASAVVEVLVTEGQVQVQRPPSTASEPGPTGSARSPLPEPPVLAARQRAIVSFADEFEPTQIATLSLGEIERVLSWHHRLLNFTDTPLSEVVANFNRRNVVQLVLIDAELASTRITASFRSDNVEAFVRLLEAGFGTRAERRGETEILLLRKVTGSN